MRINELSGPNLKALRERLGLSREKLSERCGLPVRTIQDIEQEIVKNPGLKNIQAMVRGLDLVVDVGEIKPLATTVGQMSLNELKNLIDIAKNEINARDRAEFDRLKAFEMHLRQYGDDFVDALSKIDKYQATPLRAALGLQARGPAQPSATSAPPSKASSHEQHRAHGPKKRQATGA